MRKPESLVLVGFFAAVTLFGLTASSYADTYIKHVTHTDSFEAMGQVQPARDDTSECWVTDGRACIINADSASFVMIADKNIMYMIDHYEKTYSEMPLDAVGDIKKMAGLEDDEEGAEYAEMMQGMMGGMMAMTVSVTPTEEKKKIDKWTATKYIVDMTMPMGSSKSEVWATEDIDVDYDVLRTISYAMMSYVPGFAEAMKEMAKVKGVALLSVGEASMMGAAVKTLTKLVEIADKPAPAGTFSVPEGYEKIEMKGMGRP
ncbi:MAG TPA: hypothetical protein VMY05_10035 [Acidobacteriota bacterium]|nr:hypothetical protein [Acidobacteriota bacterium]